MSKRRASKVQMPPELMSYVSMIEGLPDIVLLTDAKLRLLAANKMAEDITGYSRGEELGKNIMKYLVRRDRPRAVINVARSMRRGYLTNIEYTARFKYREAPVLVSSVVLRGVNGKIIGMLHIIKDITELKAIEVMARAIALAKGKIGHARKTEAKEIGNLKI